ncbi:AraC family transcriptional regulator [Aggregatimonas sangjinii]|uniref:AraC family transcriptional regulator n=1 Tax=Aggregatimonas sangjinii TaxID=2583587 RepID=A0A5B7SLH5_9FLAO|nr:helix-turn-helix domain-containing protein [Aggregatimonas sangjinii]QCW99424.1 AraC family transcriptional regulator [Aggregatimonas sangjinii]
MLYEQQDSFSTQIISGYLWALLNTIKRIWSGRKKKEEHINGRTALVARFELEVSKHLNASMQVADYADIFCMTPKHLSATIKYACGQSAKMLIDGAMLNEAKSLLTHTEFTVSEIAFQLGYADHSSFSRFFKRLTNISPGQFRLHPKSGHKKR